MNLFGDMYRGGESVGLDATFLLAHKIEIWMNNMTVIVIVYCTYT